MSHGIGWSPAGMWCNSETWIWAGWPKRNSTTILKMKKKTVVTHLHSDLKLLQCFWLWWCCLYRHCGKCYNPKHLKCLNPEVLFVETYCHGMCSSPVFPSIPFPAWGLGKAPLPSLLVLKCATVGMDRRCSQVPLISSCPHCALQDSLAFLQGKARAGQRWLATWRHGRSGKGRPGGILTPRGEQKILMHSAVLC